MVASHKTEISQMRGLGWRMPFTFAAFLLGALSVIGLRPRRVVEQMVHRSGRRRCGAAYLYCGPMISSLLNVAYRSPSSHADFSAPRRRKAQMADTHHNDHDHNSATMPHPAAASSRRPLFCVVPWVTALGCVALFLYADRLYAMLEPIVK